MVKPQCASAILVTLILTLFTGVCFPVLVWCLAQISFPHQANGSLKNKGEKIVGSVLIGQTFFSPKYFHSRPSAAGSGYDPLSSGGTNLGPTSKKLISGLQDDPATETDEGYAGVATLANAYRETNGLSQEILVPVDAVTRSASGLDPHISPRNAQLQAARVSRERGINQEEIASLIEQNTEQRFLGIFGEPRVNVFTLNIALDAATKR